MPSFNNQRRMVDPVSNYTSTHVSPRLQTPMQTPSLFCGLRLGTVIWIFISGVLAILAICLGAVLGSELQRSRNIKCVKTSFHLFRTWIIMSQAPLPISAQANRILMRTQGFWCANKYPVTVISSSSRTLGCSCTESPIPVSRTSATADATTTDSQSGSHADSSFSATSTATAAVSCYNYTPGSCGVHVRQYRKNQPSNPSPNFKLDVRVYDGAGALMTALAGLDAANYFTHRIITPLPKVLNITVQNADTDSVLFEYDGISWDSSNPDHCKFGGYDNLKREGDCGFTCKK